MNSIFRLTATAAALLIGATAVAADVAGYPIGYCNGEMNLKANIKYKDKGADISAALFIPPTYAATVAGNQLEAVNFALCSTMNVADLKIWVRSELDGENLSLTDVADGEYTQGWNTASLSSPVALDDAITGKGFYIGYTYTQKSKSGAISALETPHEGAFYTKCGDNPWEDRSGEGILCLEGLVFGDNLPKLNVQLTSAVPERWYIMSNGTLGVVATVRNVGVETVTGFDIEAEIEGADEIAKAHVDCEIPFGTLSSWKVDFHPAINSSTPVERNAKFTITAINGKTDEDMTDNRAEAQFKVVENAYPRIVLIEEFTTENCPNCPRVSGYLQEIDANPLYHDRIEVMCHHAGYGTDFLTNPADLEFEWFYNQGGGTYAPGLMVDRYPTAENPETPVYCPGSVEEITTFIDDRLAEPACVSVVLSAYSDEADASLIKVSVNGHRYLSTALEDMGRINVCVIEDNIPQVHQSGSGDGYLHQHVLRAINSTWGDPLEWIGDDYSYECTFTLSDEWDRNNLKILAYVSDFNPENPAECVIENAGSCSIGTSGIVSLPADGDISVSHIYNATGVETSTFSRGINIVVLSDGSVVKIIK